MFASPDREYANKIAHQLLHTGDVFLDHWCLQPGQNWTEMIPTAQSASQKSVVLVTTNTQDSHFQKAEIQRAINLYRQKTHSIIPIFLHGTQFMPFGLEIVQGVVGQTIDDAIGELQKYLRKA